MTDEEPSSSSSASSSDDLITLLYPNDVLLGRGARTNQFVGNRQFRWLAAQRQEEYTSAGAHNAKKKIARELFDCIHALGGRFLREATSEMPVEAWYRVDESVALEKCKQALRQNRENQDQGPSDGTNEGFNGGEAALIRNTDTSSGVHVGISVDPASLAGFGPVHGHPMNSSRSKYAPHLTSSVLPPALFGSRGLCAGDPRLSLFQASTSPSLIFQQPATAAQPMATNHVIPSRFNSSVQNKSGVRILPYAYPSADSMSQRQLQGLYGSFQQQATMPQSMATDLVIPSHFNRSVQNQSDFGILPDAYPPVGSMSQGMLQNLYEYRTMNTSAAAAYMSYLANNILSSRRRHLIVQQQQQQQQQRGSVSAEPGQSSRHLSVTEEVVVDQTDSDTASTVNSSTSEQAVSAVASEDDVPEFLQSSCHLSTKGEVVADQTNNRTANTLNPSTSEQAVSTAASEDDVSEFLQSSSYLRTKGEVVLDQTNNGAATSLNPSSSEQDVSAMALEDDVLEFLQSILENSDRPRFTEDQEEIEQATMTDEEKAAALSDLFGQCCDVNPRKRKRGTLDLGRKSIEFLVHRMRLELERIPEDEKRAYVEARMKCSADEFSDARMESFLRCEGMNAKLGAQRFVNYWEGRREVFGPEKFLLRMTVSEALCDDLVALEACVCRLLPHSDMSGRQLLLWEPLRHTREGYTSESMLRALWYVIEVTAQNNNDIGSGIVMIIWGKDVTIWDYDDRLYKRMTYFDTNCWPVKRIATHICCAPWIAVKFIKPIIHSLMDKHARSRRLFHDVPESQLLDVLSNYGILKDMLPTERGGTVRLNQSEWIANRRAVELKDI